MKSKKSLILEGLLHERLNEGHINESYYEDVPVIRDSRKAERVISQALTAKYKKVFQEFGDIDIEVDVFTVDDDDILVDDVVRTFGMSIVFDKDVKGQERQIYATIKKFMRNYPPFKYEKADSSFWFEVENYEDIIDVLDTIQSTDKVNLRNVYSIKDGSEIEDNIARQNKEWEDDRKYLEWEYNRSRL